MEQTRFSFSWKVAIALLLAVLSAALLPMNVFADAKPVFISDMIMLTVSGGSAVSARAKLTGDYADYQLIEEPIYSGDNCATFVAYKTTIDPDQAIVDVKAMHMDGGYSYEDYKAYLDNLQKISANLVDGLKVAVDEARDNYEKDTKHEKGASYAYEVLSMLYDDNTEQSIAELLFEGDGLGSDSEKSKAKEAQLVTIVMQGNVNIIETIEKVLMVACADGQENNFIEILNSMEEGTDTTHAYDTQISDLISTLEYVQTPVNFYKQFNIDCGNYNPKLQKIQTELENQQKKIEELIDSTAVLSADLIKDLLIEHTKMSEADIDKLLGGNEEIRSDKLEEFLIDNTKLTDEEIKKVLHNTPEMTYAEAEKIVRNTYSTTPAGKIVYRFYQKYSALSDEAQIQYDLGERLSDAMLSCKYPIAGYDTLYDLIMQRNCNVKLVNEEDAEGNLVSHIEGMDNFNIADFVPLMQALTPGQRGLCKVGFAELLLSVVLPAKDFMAGYDNVKEIFKLQGTVTGQGAATDQSDVPEGMLSVYAGVDRTLFDPDGIAMTSAAINRKNSGDDSFGKVNTTEDQRNTMALIAEVSGGIAFLSSSAILTKLIAGMISTRSANSALMQGMAHNVRTMGDLLKDLADKNARIIEGDTSKVTQEFANKAWSNFYAQDAGYQTMEGALQPSGFKSALTKTFTQLFTKVMAVINIISIIIMVVDLVMMLLDIIKEDKTDTPYVEIPRILCSVEDVFNGRYDENAGRIIEPGYVYYYGVKNPEIERGDVNDKSNPYRFGIGDVYNWTLKGPFREWIALYTTKDQRMGNPIKASSLFVSASSSEEGSKTLEYFHSTVDACDLMFFYRQTKGNQSLGKKYLHFATCTDEEMASLRTAGSVFAKVAPFAYGAIGLLVGAAGGIGIKALADKKKKQQ